MNSATEAKSQKPLEWVEAGRGLAALAVAVSHAPLVGLPVPLLPRVVPFGNIGVCFFFILSGFIIYYVHRVDLGEPSRAINFLKRRVIRIFPTYLLVLFFALAIRQFLGNADYKIDLTFEYLVEQIFLIPQIPFLGVAWSLRHEMLFYGLFLVLIINVRMGILIFAIWFCLLVYSQQWTSGCHLLTLGIPECETIIRPLLTHIFNFYFFVGIAIAVAMERGRLLELTIGSSALTAILLAANAIRPSTTLLAVVQFLACCSLVCWAVLASLKRLYAPTVLLWLGKISYPFYLTHVTFLMMAHGLVKRLGLPQWPAAFIIGICAAVIASTLIVHFYEKPLFGVFASKRKLTV